MPNPVTVNTDPRDRDTKFDYMIDRDPKVAERMAASGVKLSSMSKELPGSADNYDEDCPVIVICDGPSAGMIFSVMRDDEGNGAGSLHLQTA